MPQKILLVDDEPQVLSLCYDYLRACGYALVTATDGLQGLVAAQREKPDLIVLDLGLPDMDGLEVCRTVRRSSDVPIIILSGRATEMDKVIGLEVGADDYIVKPFSLREFVARISVILRRSSSPPTLEMIQVGDICLNRAYYEIQTGKRRVRLTPIEFEIMAVLMSQPGYTFSRDQLFKAAHGNDFKADGRTIDTHIRNLRHKLEPDELIFTVQGVGYQFGK